MRRPRKFPGVHRFLSLTARACLHGGEGPRVGEVTHLGGARKEPSSTCNLKLRDPGVHFLKIIGWSPA